MSYRIDESCNEDWDGMELHDDGRFCQKCQHAVVDATKMTKGEFEALYKKAKGDVCAQFRSNPVGDGVFRRDLARPSPLGSFVLLSTLMVSAACASEAPIEPIVVPLVDPGSQLVEDKTPIAVPVSSLDAAVDTGWDSGADAGLDSGLDASDAAADIVERRHLRRGRVRHRH